MICTLYYSLYIRDCNVNFLIFILKVLQKTLLVGSSFYWLATELFQLKSRLPPASKPIIRH